MKAQPTKMAELLKLPDQIKKQNPERTWQAVVAAFNSYLEAKIPPRKRDATATAADLGLRVVPKTDQVDEIARHIVEALLAIDDPRTWDTVAVEALRTGDVFVRYDIGADGRPEDEEVTVHAVKGTGRKRKIIVANAKGVVKEVEATSDYLIRAHRPSLADLRAELADEARP